MEPLTPKQLRRNSSNNINQLQTTANKTNTVTEIPSANRIAVQLQLIKRYSWRMLVLGICIRAIRWQRPDVYTRNLYRGFSRLCTACALAGFFRNGDEARRPKTPDKCPEIKLNQTSGIKEDFNSLLHAVWIFIRIFLFFGGRIGPRETKRNEIEYGFLEFRNWNNSIIHQYSRKNSVQFLFKY